MKPFGTGGAFRPDSDVVRRLAVRGAGATVLSSGVGLCIQIVGTVILARILTPTDFGLVAMVTTFSLLLANFGLNGFTEAVLQVEQLDRFLASNLFWINAGVGFLLSVSFAAAGSLLTRFYGNPLVAHVAVGVSPMIFLTSLSVLHLALLKRAMHFSMMFRKRHCGRHRSGSGCDPVRAGRLGLLGAGCGSGHDTFRPSDWCVASLPLDSKPAAPRVGNCRNGQVCNQCLRSFQCQLLCPEY